MTITSIPRRLVSYGDALKAQKNMLAQAPEQRIAVCKKVVALHQRIGADYQAFNKQGKLNPTVKKAFVSSAKEVEQFLGEIGVKIIRKTDTQRERHLSSSSKREALSKKTASIHPKSAPATKGKKKKEGQEALPLSSPKVEDPIGPKIVKPSYDSQFKLWQDTTQAILAAEQSGYEKCSDDFLNETYTSVASLARLDRRYKPLKAQLYAVRNLRMPKKAAHKSLQTRTSQPKRFREAEVQVARFSQFDERRYIGNRRQESLLGHGISCPSYTLQFGELALGKKSFWDRNNCLTIEQEHLEAAQDLAVEKFEQPYLTYVENGRISNYNPYLETEEVWDMSYHQSLEPLKLSGNIGGVGSKNKTDFSTVVTTLSQEVIATKQSRLVAISNGAYTRALVILFNPITKTLEYAISDSHGAERLNISQKTYAYFTKDPQDVTDILYELMGSSRMIYYECYAAKQRPVQANQRAVAPPRLSTFPATQRSSASSSSKKQGQRRRNYKAASQSKVSSTTQQVSAKHFSSSASKQRQRKQPQVAKKWSSNWL
ncbi:MAG: hypothetical protein HYZ47_00550 [Simkania negevensis]|nr:hypothetical protein [Simkania negevensis]